MELNQVIGQADMAFSKSNVRIFAAWRRIILRPAFQSFIPKLNCELYHESWEMLPGSLTLFREPFAALDCILMLSMAGGLHEYTLRKIIQALSRH